MMRHAADDAAAAETIDFLYFRFLFLRRCRAAMLSMPFIFAPYLDVAMIISCRHDTRRRFSLFKIEPLLSLAYRYATLSLSCILMLPFIVFRQMTLPSLLRFIIMLSLPLMPRDTADTYADIIHHAADDAAIDISIDGLFSPFAYAA